jgi:hypothetical protein
MRWLLIVLLVSLTALLVAAVGMALHIWVQRARLSSRPPSGRASGAAEDGTAEEIEQETEL